MDNIVELGCLDDIVQGGSSGCPPQKQCLLNLWEAGVGKVSVDYCGGDV